MAKTTEQQPAPSLSLAYSQPPFLLAGRDDQHVLIPRNVPNFCAGCGIFLYPVCCFTPVTSCRRDGVSMVCIIKLILLNTLLAWIPFKHKLKQLTTISVFLSTFAELWAATDLSRPVLSCRFSFRALPRLARAFVPLAHLLWWVQQYLKSCSRAVFPRAGQCVPATWEAQHSSHSLPAFPD